MGEQKLPGIQIARAIAALSIVYFHSWTILDRFPKGTSHPFQLLADYGWLGVDLFFAISGFVICLIVTKPGFSPLPFLVKRALRIYPLWLATLTIFAVLAGAWRGFQPTETAGFFFYSATLLPTDGFPFYDIGWSLQHEMLFYTLACLIVPLFGIWGLICALALGSIAFHILPMPWFPTSFFFYYPEFLAGVLAFLVAGKVRLSMLPLAIGVGLLWYFVGIEGQRSLVPISLFFLAIGFANLPAIPGIVEVGNASYSIYLLHPIVFLIAKAGTLHIASLTWTEEPIRLTSMCVVVAVSLLSWRYFERLIMAPRSRRTLQTIKA